MSKQYTLFVRRADGYEVALHAVNDLEALNVIDGERLVKLATAAFARADEGSIFTAPSVIEQIAEERQRQIEQEGFDADHDDQHIKGELAACAAAYAWLSSLDQDEFLEQIKRAGSATPGLLAVVNELWPKGWEFSWLKPKSRRLDLIRAAALIVAEIERLDRTRERGRRSAP